MLAVADESFFSNSRMAVLTNGLLSFKAAAVQIVVVSIVLSCKSDSGAHLTAAQNFLRCSLPSTIKNHTPSGLSAVVVEPQTHKSLVINELTLS